MERGDANYLAPIYDQILVHFTKLMEVYQAQKFEGGFSNLLKM